jgi:hypothetical protein
MVAISTSSVTVPSPTLPPPGRQPQDTAVAASASDPVDIVTLSAEAHLVLDGQAPPPPPAPAPTAAPANATPPPPSQDEITAAVAALNDTSDTASVDDQIKAYALISNLVAKGQVLPDNRNPPANVPPGGMIKASDAQALLASPFAQRLNQVAVAIDNQKDTGAADNGYDLANTLDRALAAFDALSADDQKVYVAAKTIYSGLASGQTPVIGSVADYRANQQAQADVDRAVQAAQDDPAYAAKIQTDATGARQNFASRTGAMGALARTGGDAATAALAGLAQTDPGTQAFTDAAQAFFAKYGPAPGPHSDTGQGFPQGPGAQRSSAATSPADAKALMDALAKVDNTDGAVMAKDQVAALKLLNSYAKRAGPAGLAVVLNAAVSPYAAHSDQEVRLVNNYLVPGKDPYPQILDHLSALSPDDQTTYFGASDTAADGTVLFGSLGSLKQNLATREQVLQIYTAVTKAYGVQDLAHFTNRADKDNPALAKLEALFRAPQGNDDWTAAAEDFLSHTTPDDLGLAPVGDDGDPDMKKALETLKQVADNQTAFIKAVKTGHMTEWRAVTEAEKAKLKAKADAAMASADTAA